MKETKLDEVVDLEISVLPQMFAGSIGLWVIVVMLMVAAFSIPIGFALFGGVIVVGLHWFSETIHQLGHAWAARHTGYPMLGIRYGTRAILATALYPPDEPALPAKTHIRRATGGPFFSAGLSVLAFIILMLSRTAAPLWQFVAWFFFLENLFVMTLQVFIPLGFNDGGTIWYWIRQR